MTAAVVYLIITIVGALVTFLAVAPAPRAGRLPSVYFASAFVLGDLLVVWLGLAVVITAVFAGFGALGEWPGWVGLVIAAASWVTLYVATSGPAKQTAAAVDAALEQGLGAGYLDAVPASVRSSFIALAVHRWTNPFGSNRAVERIRNLSYGPAGKFNQLDVYRPKGAVEGAPCLLYIHGGAWTMGTKNNQGLPLIRHLVSEGWVCVNINYRLSPAVKFPEHLVDVKRAIAWWREHGAEYGADTRFLAVSGGSAGGHLTAWAALTANDPDYQPGFESADTTVQAAVPLYGVYDLLDRRGVRPDKIQIDFLTRKVFPRSPQDDPDAWNKASPVTLIGPEAPPFFVAHGERDSLLFVEDARYFAQALREASPSPVVYAELPGAQHQFDNFLTVRSAALVEGVSRFLAYVRATTPGTSTEEAADHV